MPEPVFTDISEHVSHAAGHAGHASHAAHTGASIFFHTNRPVRPAARLGYAKHVTTGWWYDPVKAKKDMRRVGGNTRSERWLMQTYKYAWVVNASLSEPPPSEPLALIDTDTVVQCTGRELAAKFAAFGTPLVVGAEPAWWPDPDFRGFDPWSGQRPKRHGRYPNSGMLFGTRAGFRRVHDIMRAFPRYPCCPKRLPAALGEGGRPAALPAFLAQTNASGSCLVEDQHCLQAALRALTLGVDYSLDSDARRSAARTPGRQSLSG